MTIQQTIRDYMVDDPRCQRSILPFVGMLESGEAHWSDFPESAQQAIAWWALKVGPANCWTGGLGKSASTIGHLVGMDEIRRLAGKDAVG